MASTPVQDVDAAIFERQDQPPTRGRFNLAPVAQGDSRNGALSRRTQTRGEYKQKTARREGGTSSGFMKGRSDMRLPENLSLTVRRSPG